MNFSHPTSLQNQTPGSVFFAVFFSQNRIQIQKNCRFQFWKGASKSRIGAKRVQKEQPNTRSRPHIVVWLPSSLGSRFWFCSMWFCHFYPGFRFVKFVSTKWGIHDIYEINRGISGSVPGTASDHERNLAKIGVESTLLLYVFWSMVDVIFSLI